MQKTMKYTIFKTKWGYFGLASTDNGLLRTCLPLSNPEKVKRRILKASFVGQEPSVSAGRLTAENRASSIEFDKDLFKLAQRQITAYFEGDCVNFRDIPVALDGLGLFARRVLISCREIGLGQTVSYGRLAEMAGKPGAARAVGGALAKNPLPLIIPCHRVVCTNGKIGGFSAAGGRNLKEKLLKHEYQSLTSSKNS
jgi:methylated-DNA-[protein]-cysteine S-methyltransferase